eukprot:scaffold26387_cov153-Skeletonema_marinoi.AAC.3
MTLAWSQRDQRAINQQKPRLKHTTTTYLNQYTYYSIMKLSTTFFVASAVCSSVSGFTAVPSGNACQRIITANQPSAAASRTCINHHPPNVTRRNGTYNHGCQ